MSILRSFALLSLLAVPVGIWFTAGNRQPAILAAVASDDDDAALSHANVDAVSLPGARVDATGWATLAELQRVFSRISFNITNPQSGTAAVVAVLDVRETRCDPAGRYERRWLLQTDLHHPLIRVVDVVQAANGAEGERVVRRVAMAADHLILALGDGILPQELHGAGFVVRDRLVGTDYSLVAFAATSVDALPEAQTRLRALAPSLGAADPDFVSYTLDMPAEAAVVSEPHRIVVEGENLIPADGEWATALPNDSGFGNLWGMRNTGQLGGAVVGMDINAADAWDIRTDASTVVVGIVDTGIRTTHQDLAPNLWSNSGELGIDALRRNKATNGVDDDGNGYIDDVFGINAITNTGLNPGTVNDDNGHGTHCAGTIGGAGNNAAGVTGVCWKVRMMALKFLNQNGSGFDSAAIKCLAYARTQGAQLVSNSWGGGGYNSALLTTIQQTRDADMVFVAAAGNNNTDNDISATYPCGYAVENVVAVAAMNPDGTRASYSNYGATTVDVAAPGTQIYSTGISTDTSYSWKSGTSMAAPHIAGIVALMRAQLPTLGYPEIVSRLLVKTNPMAEWDGIVAQGGRVDAARCVSESLPLASVSASAVTAVRGGNVSVSVVASDPLGGDVSYQWRKAADAVPGATGATLSLNGLQRSDAGYYDCMVTGSGGAVASATVAIGLQHGADFDGNGSPDLLWTQTSTGRRILWLMNGTVRLTSTPVELGTIPVDWTIGGAADFDGNGSPDILWTQASTGRRILWLMNRTARLTSTPIELGTIPAEWSLDGAADFDGNGSPDVLWTQASTGRRIIWLMNGTARLTSTPVELGSVPAEWRIGGTADFDGNGSPDILWTQTSTGRRILWLMEGTVRQSAVAVELGTVPANWRIEGTGDFDGNGRPDIIWTDTFTGRRILWRMNGLTRLTSSAVELGTIPVDWSIGNR